MIAFKPDELINNDALFYSYTSQGTQPCLGPLEKGLLIVKGGGARYACFLCGNLIFYIVQL